MLRTTDLDTHCMTYRVRVTFIQSNSIIYTHG